MLNFFKPNRRLISSIKIRNYSSHTTITATQTASFIDNSEINNNSDINSSNNNNNNINNSNIKNYNNNYKYNKTKYNNLDNKDSIKNEIDYFDTSRDDKYHLRKCDKMKYGLQPYHSLESNDQIFEHFNKFYKSENYNETSLLRELDYYLSYAASDISKVDQLYNQLPGNIKKHHYVFKSFLKFYQKKSNDQLFMKIIKESSPSSFDAESYCLVIEHLMKPDKERDYIFLDKAVKKLKKLIGDETLYLSPRLRSLLCNYYIEIGDINSAERYLTSCSLNKQLPLESLVIFISILVDTNPLKALEFTNKIISKYNKVIPLPDLISIMDPFFRKKKTTEAIKIWDLILSIKDFHHRRFHHLLFEYLVTIRGYCDTAWFLLESRFFRDPNFNYYYDAPPLLDPFFKFYLKNKNEAKIRFLLKFCRSKAIPLSPQLVYHVFLKSNLFEHFKIFESMSREKVFQPCIGNIVAYCERNDSTENKIILNKFNEFLQKSNTSVSYCITEIVSSYLSLDDFQKAIQWYTSKQSLFNVEPSINDFHAFLVYHKSKNESDLVDFWNKTIKQHRIGIKHLEQRTIFKSDFEHKLNKKEDFISLFNSYLEPSDFEVEFIKSRSKIEQLLKLIQQNTFYNNDISNNNNNKNDNNNNSIDSNNSNKKELIVNNSSSILVNVKEIELLVQKNDIATLKIHLVKFIKENIQVPQTIIRILDCIYLNNPEDYVDFIKTAFGDTSLHNQLFDSIIFKTNIEKLSDNNFSEIFTSSYLWSSVLIYSIRSGDVKLAFRVIQSLNNKDIEVSDQALYILALELRNIMFKHQGIQFNYTTHTNIFFFNNDNDDSDCSSILRDSKSQFLRPYFLNHPDIETKELYELILFNKILIFKLYQKYILEAPNQLSTSTNLFYRYFYIPLTNLCTSLLIECDDQKNAQVLLERAFSSNTFNRETLLLYIKAKKEFNIDQDNDSDSIENKLNFCSKQLNITKEEMNQILSNPQIYKENSFIKEFLKKPKQGEDVEIRNNYLSYWYLNMDESFIYSIKRFLSSTRNNK